MERIEKGKVLKTRDLLPIKAGHTISKAIADNLVLFSLGKGTDISAETYLEDKSYYVLGGEVLVNDIRAKQGDFVAVGRGTPLGIIAVEDSYLLEGTWEGENDIVCEKNKAISAKDAVEIVEDSISNVDLIKRPGAKFGIIAFDEGQALTPHKAPGDAMILPLEGRAVLTMGGVPNEVEAGDIFVFEKNVLHAVEAKGKFKMGILLVI